MKLFEDMPIQNKLRYWSIASMPITLGVLALTLFMLIPTAPDFYDEPKIIKISGNNLYIHQEMWVEALRMVFILVVRVKNISLLVLSFTTFLINCVRVKMPVWLF